MVAVSVNRQPIKSPTGHQLYIGCLIKRTEIKMKNLNIIGTQIRNAVLLLFLAPCVFLAGCAKLPDDAG
jgi:hypothetical protein